MSLNNKSKIQMEAFPADAGDKHNGDFYRYEREDRTPFGRGINEISLDQNPYQRDKFDICIGFNTDNPSAREDAIGLLGAAGFEVETKAVHGAEQSRRMIIKNVTENDLMRATIALAQTLPKDRHDRYDALLSRDEAGQVVAQELGRLKTTPLQAGLINITRVAMSADRLREMGISGSMGYMDIDFSGYPIGPVTFMREDGMPVGQGGRTQVEISTRIEGDKQQFEKIRQGLAEAGIKTTENKGGFLVANAGADSVALALAKNGMIPAAIGVEAALTAKQLRPDHVEAETRGQAPAVTAKAASLG